MPPSADALGFLGSAGFREAVYQLVRQVSPGRVVSYGGLAAMLGRPRAARGVGAALQALPGESDVPWWRVVNRNGEISSPSHDHTAQLQRALLRAEGVVFDSRGRIDWKRFGWERPAFVQGPPGGEDAPSAAESRRRQRRRPAGPPTEVP